MGLPVDGKLKHAQLAARVEDCLGTRKQRTAEQAQKLKTIADVIRIPESSVEAHLAWGTWHFQDIVQKRTGGRNPFDNATAMYRGSPDDAALNAGVLRYHADPAAVAQFAADADPNGKIDVPVLTVHAINDPTAFVELEDTFRRTMEAAGTAGHLVQTFTDFNQHSYFADPIYPTLFEALLAWVDKGEKPAPAAIAARCKAFEAEFGPGCKFLPDYRVAPLEGRVTPRRPPS